MNIGLKKIVSLLVIYLICSSHDMYLKMNTFHLDANTKSTIQLYNGTFEKSDNIITRDRMVDVSLVGNGKRSEIDSSSWSDNNNISVLNFTTGEEGTWVAGVSTKAKNIEMDADAFSDYLVHDGVLDMLEYRKKNNLADKNAIEKYSKHVKTIFQVGKRKTEDWNTVLGYPIEFVPLQNPYQTKVQEEFQVTLLRNGEPFAGQLVYVGNAETSHSHDEDSDHQHHAKQYRTNENGILTFKLDVPGQWYLRTIAMEETDAPGLTHESNWATLTFEVPGVSSSSPDSHEHVHKDGTVHSHDSTSSWGFNKLLIGLAGIILLFGLWYFVRTKSKGQSN